MMRSKISAQQTVLGSPLRTMQRGGDGRQFSPAAQAKLEKLVSGALQKINARQETESINSDEGVIE